MFAPQPSRRRFLHTAGPAPRTIVPVEMHRRRAEARARLCYSWCSGHQMGAGCRTVVLAGCIVWAVRAVGASQAPTVPTCFATNHREIHQCSGPLNGGATRPAAPACTNWYMTRPDTVGSLDSVSSRAGFPAGARHQPLALHRHETNPRQPPPSPPLARLVRLAGQCHHAAGPCRSPHAPADLVVRHAAVYTVEGRSGWTDAFAVRDGRYVALGEREVRRHIGPQTRVLDLAGAMVMPGINDVHVH